jgi:bacillithiol system protein YtxJ
MSIWQNITSIADVEAIKAASADTPCMIFKHSTTCPISHMAKNRVEMGWNFDDSTLKAYYLDLKAHREVSNYIAETFQVHHESPQVILLKNGTSFHDCSHLDINMAEINDVFTHQV